MQPVSVLVLPGLGNSGPDHWQSIWEAQCGYRRVEQAAWDRPLLPDWLFTLDESVSQSPHGVVLVAHSLACSLVAHFAQARPAARVLGAFLVSPADVDSPRCTPDETRCFSPMPLRPLPFPATVVASSDDPYVTLERADFFARAWHAEFIDVGRAGHINAGSGHGPWPEGLARFRACLARWSLPRTPCA